MPLLSPAQYLKKLFDGMKASEVTLLEAVARTADVDSGVQNTPFARGLHLIVNVTAVGAAPSVVPHLQGWDWIAGEWYDLLIGGALVDTGRTVLKLYPGITVISEGSASDALPNRWRLFMDHGNGDSITYSAGAALLV